MGHRILVTKAVHADDDQMQSIVAYLQIDGGGGIPALQDFIQIDALKDPFGAMRVEDLNQHHLDHLQSFIDRQRERAKRLGIVLDVDASVERLRDELLREAAEAHIDRPGVDDADY